jgi:hypothetical protein
LLALRGGEQLLGGAACGAVPHVVVDVAHVAGHLDQLALQPPDAVVGVRLPLPLLALPGLMRGHFRGQGV